MADILGVGPTGQFIAVEVKRPGTELTLAQIQFRNAVREHGGFAAVVYSIDDLAAAWNKYGLRPASMQSLSVKVDEKPSHG